MELQKNIELAQKELNQLFGDNLTGLLVYGSAAGDDYLPGSSDLNLLVVLSTLDLQALDTMRQFLKRMGKVRMPAPLMLTREQIWTSADVFPIEYLEIQEKHRLIQGEDPFAGLEINQKNIRHECEHELKGRLLRLRQSFLEIGANAKHLQALLLSAHNANFPAFRATLRIKQVIPPLKKESVTAALAQHFGLDGELFKTVFQLRVKTLTLDGPGMRAVFEKYLVEVEKLAAIVDRL